LEYQVSNPMDDNISGHEIVNISRTATSVRNGDSKGGEVERIKDTLSKFRKLSTSSEREREGGRRDIDGSVSREESMNESSARRGKVIVGVASVAYLWVVGAVWGHYCGG
jgi:hypothetical protein